MGVAYGMALADVVIGPGIPSASARGGGIMYPIMQSIADAYESKPGPTARRAGAFLAIAVSQIDTIICTMFLTAMAGNPLIAELAKSQGVEITWMTWFVRRDRTGYCEPNRLALFRVFNLSARI